MKRKVQNLLQPAVPLLKELKIKLPDLSDQEFYQVFIMTKEQLHKLAKWKQSVKNKMRNYIECHRS